MNTTDDRREHALVVGGSIAGLTAARVLADRFDRVTVLERHPLPEPGAAGTIAPQGRYPHVLLAGGQRALETLFDGFGAELCAAGGVVADVADGHWWAAGALRSRDATGIAGPLASRPLIETVVRDRVRALPRVAFRTGITVRGLEADGARVTGVRVDDAGVAETISADLVVDASGRGSRAGRWLEAAGWAAPPTTTVEVDLAYTALTLRRRPGDLAGAAFALVQNLPPVLARFGLALPQEGDRWAFVVGSYFGDRAPTDRDGLLAFTESLPDQVLARLLRDAEWLTEPSVYRFPSSQRRHFERLRRLPAGFVAIGDAVCSFNPIFGQGMTSAVLQAIALGVGLDRHGNTPPLPRAVARAAARVVANPWQTAAGADFGYPQTVGRKAPGTDAVNRYVTRVFRASAVDPRVNRRLAEVQNLLAPPSALLRPALAVRVLRASRRVPAWTPAAVTPSPAPAPVAT